MRFFLCYLGVISACYLTRADSLPVFTTQPTNQNVLSGNTATFLVAATGASSFQWRFNGTDISGATNSTLQVANVQTNNTGYYMAIAKNATGWVPSGLAYLSVGSFNPSYNGGGMVPLSNVGGAQAHYEYDINGGGPITNGTAQVVAGPRLDQMQPVGDPTPVSNGYFDDLDQMVPTVLPGQIVYYRIAFTYPYNGGTQTQISTALKLIAGGGSYPTPSTLGLKFPIWLEWPDPSFANGSIFGGGTNFSSWTNQTRITGETVRFTNIFFGCEDYGIPTGQWRKDGDLLTNATNFFLIDGSFCGDFAAVLTLTNVQASDAGDYDVQVLGNNWIIGPETTLSVQITNGNGVFLSPRSDSTNFLADLQGVAGRNYAIQSSSNLLNWNALVTLSNGTGLVTLTNALGTNNALFYRAMLLP